MNTLEFLYGTAFGRILLRPLAGKHVSALSGRLLDTGASKVLIPVFIRRYHMDVSEYDLTRIHSFNDFFCRPIKPGMRPVDMEPGHLIAPCDGLLKVYTISEDRILRKNSFTALMDTYHHYRNTFAATLTGTCRSRYFYAKVRGYKDSMEASLSEENIPVSLYTGLIDTVHQHLDTLHEYIALKKEVLGYNEFHPYDLYVPLSQDGEKSFSCTFEEACETVKNALQPLGKQYINALETGMNGGWIDIYENKGKRSGAYSWGVYGVHPYVLLNFQPRYNSISTLAHELERLYHILRGSSLYYQ